MNYADLSAVYGEVIGNSKYGICQVAFEHSEETRGNPEYEGQKERDIITVLVDKRKGEVVMSDSAMERRTNKAFCDTATGDVLIAGLGLGMVVLAIQGKPNVKSITIVEKDKKLGELVLSRLQHHLSKKVSIVYSDIFEYRTQKKFDTIYFDIWNTVEKYNYMQMRILRARFKNSLVGTTGLTCWREDDCRKEYILDKLHDFLVAKEEA